MYNNRTFVSIFRISYFWALIGRFAYQEEGLLEEEQTVDLLEGVHAAVHREVHLPEAPLIMTVQQQTGR